jgi:hypothetical protein
VREARRTRRRRRDLVSGEFVAGDLDGVARNFGGRGTKQERSTDLPDVTDGDQLQRDAVGLNTTCGAVTATAASTRVLPWRVSSSRSARVWPSGVVMKKKASTPLECGGQRCGLADVDPRERDPAVGECPRPFGVGVALTADERLRLAESIVRVLAPAEMTA